MALSKAEIRNRALEELGVIQVGTSPQDQDKVRVEEYYDQVYDILKDDGLNIWASTANCPDKLCPHMIALVAERGLNTYSTSNERYLRITNMANVARREIPKMVQPEYEGLDDPTDY